MYHTLTSYCNQLSNLPLSPFQQEKINLCAFDRLTFTLLQKILTNDNSDDYQIIIPDRNYQGDILSSVIICVALNKYLKNCNEYLFENELKIGDIIYDPSKNANDSEYVFLGKQGTQYICTFLNPKQKEGDLRIYKTEQMLQNCVILKHQKGFNWTRNTLKGRFKDYLDYFSALIPKAHFKVLTQFTSKILIISDNQIKENLYNIPFRYNGEQLNLPIEPMIEMAKNWAEAANLLNQDIEGKIKEIVVIGKQKYQDCINDIINFKNNSRSLQKIILIGCETAVTTAALNTWHWTLDEVNLLKNIPMNRYQKIKVIDNVLKQHFKEIEAIQFALIQKHGLVEREVRQVIQPMFAAFYRYFFHLTAEKATELIEKAQTTLEDKEGNYEIICDNAGLESEQKKLYKNMVLNVLNKTIQHLKTNNKKFDACKNPDAPVIYKLICDATDCDAINTHVKKNGIRRTKALSVKDFEDIVQGKLNIDNLHLTHFIFPYIYLKYQDPSWYYYLLQKARAIANVILLYYDEIEEQRVFAFETFYSKENLRRLRSKDRLKFTDIAFQFIENQLDKNVLNPKSITAKPQQSSETIDKETDEMIHCDFNQQRSYALKEHLEVDSFETEAHYKDFFAQFFIFDQDIKHKRQENSLVGGANIAYEDTFGVKIPAVEIQFDNDTIYQYQGNYPFAWVRGAETQKISAKNVQLGYQLVHFDINFDNCFAILKQIKDDQLQKLVKEIILASKDWRNWLKSAFEIKRAQLKNAEKAKIDLHQRINPIVSQSTFNGWIENQEDYFFPRSNDDLQKIVEYYPKLKVEKERLPLIERGQSILNLKRKNAGLREIVTKLNGELTIYICDKTQKKSLSILSKLTDNQIDTLLKTKSLIKVVSIQTV